MTIRNGILESIDRTDIVFGKIVIPEGVTMIGNEVFRDNKELMEVEFPSTLKKIGTRAFFQCSFLKEIKFNNELQEIHEAAFYRCDLLSDIKLPDTVTRLDPHAFSGCSYLKTVKLSENISSINKFVFSECTSLNKIEFPKNISAIGEYAFSSCTSLRKVMIPSTVEIIKASSFHNCQFLSEVILEEGIEKIERSAFESCFSLQKINFPKSLRVIEKSAFRTCTLLKNIELNENLEEIQEYAFEGSGIVEITFPKSIKVIASSLCINCERLESVHFHEEIEGISEDSFDGCFLLSEMTIGDYKTAINSSTGDILINYLYFCANEILKEKYESIEEFLKNNCIEELKQKAITNAGFMEDTILKFKNIFKKLRKSYDVPPNILKYLKIEATENFSYKIWNQIKKIYAWEWHQEEREKAFAEMIEVFGLFYKDKNQQKRIDTFLKLFQEGPSILFDFQMEELLYDDYPEYKKEIKDAYEIKNKQFYFANGIVIPEEFSMYLSGIMTLTQAAKIKKLSGTYGKRINDFIKEGYLLKESEVYVLKEEKRNDEVMRLVLLSNSLENYLNHNAIHRIFDGCNCSFNKDFYEFFIENLELILSHRKIQSKIKEIGKQFDNIQNYYHFSSGIEKVSLKQALDYLEKNRFYYKEGNLEFAHELQKAGVTSTEKFNYYENIYEKNKVRRLYSLVRRSNIYEIDGYIVKAELLRKDDPLTLIVGEPNYTNCCQTFQGIGHNCMAHATNSPDGGIFVTKLFEDGNWVLLTQSWDWQNNNLYCHDNIEGTDTLEKGGDRLKRAVSEVFKLDAEFIIEKSKEEVEKYVSTGRKKLEKFISDNREEELERLNQLEKKNVIKVVTCGTGYDDLGLRKFFKKSIKVNESQFINGQVFHLSNFQPVDYNNSKPYFDNSYSAYSDSEDFQYIMAGSIEDLASFKNEPLIPIYRDERRVLRETGTEIRNHTAKRIADIEKSSYPKGMLSHQKISQTDFKNSDIYLGEDWYLIYENKENGNIYISDLARVEPVLKDEKGIQQQEIFSTLSTLINSSNEIEADLKEDTSYMLYLMNKRLGYIEQIGEDIAYPFDNEENTKIVTEREQEEILKARKRLEDKNKKIMMHKVRFKKI